MVKEQKKDIKKTEESEEENLEEQVEDINEEIDEDKFNRFFQSGENVIPILEKVQNSNKNFNLETEVPETKAEQPEREKKFQPSYTSFINDEGESRAYQNSEPPVLRPVSRGNEFHPGFIDPLRGRQIQNDSMQPTMVETGAVNQDRRLPFERDEKKYKEVKFKKFV